MERYIFEALFMMDESEFALQRMKKRYAEMMSYDYPTLFEVWDFRSTSNDANSNNLMHGVVVRSAGLCGIQPISPGFKTFRIAPQMGTLTEAEASMVSSSGEIRAKIIERGSNLTITATVPQGTTDEVVFPIGKRLLLTAGVHPVKGK